MKKKITAILLCSIILSGFTSCFHWSKSKHSYVENYIFIADTTIKMEDSIRLEIKGDMENLRLWKEWYLSAEEKAKYFTDSHTLSFYIAHDSIKGLKEEKILTDRYEFRYFDELMARFDTIMLCQKKDTIVIWTPINDEYKNPFLQDNWNYDWLYSDNIAPGYMRSFAYYIGKSDVEKLRLKKEKVGR